MRLVVDTNVFVEARYDRKKKKACYKMIQHLQTGHLILLYSPEIYQEVNKVLHAARASRTFLQKMNRAFTAGEEISNIIEQASCEDPSDIKFLDCALTAQASYIISRDNDLHSMDTYCGVRIRNASEFYCENPLIGK